jgi:hypothetical protein
LHTDIKITFFIYYFWRPKLKIYYRYSDFLVFLTHYLNHCFPMFIMFSLSSETMDRGFIACYIVTHLIYYKLYVFIKAEHVLDYCKPYSGT